MADCPTTAEWQKGLQALVADITTRPESDGQLLAIINTDGTNPIVVAP